MASELEVAVQHLPLERSSSSRPSSPSTSPNELSLTPPALAPQEPFLNPPFQTPPSKEDMEGTANRMVEEVLLEVILDAHRDFRLGLAFLYGVQDEPVLSDGSPGRKKLGDRAEVRPHTICTTPGLDIFGQSAAVNGKLGRNPECWCPACGRQMAAARFAPHLEKCLGMGRNSFRQANRRLASVAATTANPLQTSTRSGGQRSYAEETNMEMELDSDDEVLSFHPTPSKWKNNRKVVQELGGGGSGEEFHPGEAEEEEDEDWLSVRKRRPRRRPAPSSRAAPSTSARNRRGQPTPVVGEEPDLFRSLLPDLFPGSSAPPNPPPTKEPTPKPADLSDSNSRDTFEAFPAPGKPDPSMFLES